MQYKNCITFYTLKILTLKIYKNPVKYIKTPENNVKTLSNTI